MRNSRRLWKLVIILGFCITTLLSPVQGVSAKGGTDYTVTVNPGETKTIVIPVGERSSDPTKISYIILTASNSQPTNRTNGSASILATSSCAAVQKAVNFFGQTLYAWTAQFHYDFNGVTVNIWGHSAWPDTGWGWSFDHAGWVVAGNNTAQAAALSTGYFTHPTNGKKYARVQAVIKKTGACSLSGSTGNW